MDRTASALVAAAVAACALLALLGLPYGLTDASAVGVYYGVGPVNPLVVAAFAAVAVVALAAGAAGRADPATVSGLGLVVGLGSALVALPWALEAGPVAAGLPVDALFAYHRFAVLAAAGVVAVASLAASPLASAKGP